MKQATKILITVLVGTIIVSVGACGGGNGGSTGGNVTKQSGAAGLAVACQALTWNLPTATVSPLGTVDLTNLQDPILSAVKTNPNALYAEVLDDKGTPVTTVPVAAVQDANGSWHLQLFAPADPSVPFKGGDVNVRLRVGADHCPSQTLTVSALPDPASPDKVLNDSVTALKAFVTQAAAPFGYFSFSDLQQAAADFVARADQIQATGELGVPAQMMPLLLAVDGINALDAMLASNEFTDQERRQVAALLASIGKQGYASGLQDLVSRIKQLAPSGTNTGLGNGKVVALHQIRPQVLSAASTKVRRAKGGSGRCAKAIAGDYISMKTAYLLDKYMSIQHQTEINADPTKSLTALGIKGIEASLPVASVLSAGAAAGAGAFLYIHDLIQQFTIDTLPSSFKSVKPKVLVPGTHIDEDYEAAGKDARWDKLMATAVSKGMELSGPTLDGIQQILGAAGWAKGLGETKPLIDRAVDFGVDQVKGKAKSSIWDVWSTLQKLAQAQGCFRLAPHEYGPADITDSTYTKTKVRNGDAIALGAGARNNTDIKLVHTGTAGVILQTRKNHFGGRDGFWAALMHVDKEVLDATPNPYFVRNLGELKRFTVYIRHSAKPQSPAVQASKIQGGGSLQGQPTLSGGNWVFDYKTPDKKKDYPVKVELTRQAPIPDAAGSTERTTVVTMRSDVDVELVPDTACVQRGDTRKLAAQIYGRDQADFTWKIISGGGSLGGATPGNDPTVEDNTYIAPGSATTAKVKVIVNNTNGNKEVSDTTTITVGKCNAKVTVDGRLAASAKAWGSADSSISDEFKEFDSDHDAMPLADIPTVPARPTSYWRGRSEHFTSGLMGVTASLASYDNGTLCDEAQNGSCPKNFGSGYAGTLTFTGNTSADATYAVSGDGVASLDYTYSGKLTCKDVGRSSSVECSESGAGTPWEAAFYTDLSAPTSYQLDAALQCTEGSRGVGGANLSIYIMRFPAGATQKADAMPPNGYPVPNLAGRQVFSPDGYTHYNMHQVLSNSNACESGTSELHKTFDLAGPVKAGTTDHVIVLVIGIVRTALASNGNIDAFRKELSSNPGAYNPPPGAGAPQFPTPPDPSLLQPLAGNYSGSVHVTGQLSFTAK